APPTGSNGSSNGRQDHLSADMGSPLVAPNGKTPAGTCCRKSDALRRRRHPVRVELQVLADEAHPRSTIWPHRCSIRRVFQSGREKAQAAWRMVIRLRGPRSTHRARSGSRGGRGGPRLSLAHESSAVNPPFESHKIQARPPEWTTNK